MKILTIRGIDEELSSRLKDAAKRESLSVNKLVLKVLKSRFGQIKEKKFTREHHDLDSLFGQWSREDYESVKSAVEAQRGIDRDLWE